jgi:hypothetical protein
MAEIKSKQLLKPISGSFVGSFTGSLQGTASYVESESFLRNRTHDNWTDVIHTYGSIFNPSNLTVLSSSVFIIESQADYYVLGDVINSGSIIVSGTFHIGGALLNYGSITGPGIIE